MRCAVISCKNSSKQKPPGVTFHRFPRRDEATLKKWLTAIRRENWQPKKHNRICSHHFEGDCIRKVQSKTFVLRFAVPTLFLHDPLRNDSPEPNNVNSEDFDHLNISSPVENKCDPFDDIKPENADEPTSLEKPYLQNSFVVSTTRPTERPQSLEDVIKIEESGSTNLEVCRVCLSVGCKMFRLKDELEQAYAQVTGIFVSAHDGLPQLLCWECASRVSSAVKLCDRATKAHNILTSLLALQGSINMKDILSINRKQMKLMTSLSCEYFKQADHHHMIEGDFIEIKKTDNFDDNTEMYINTDEIGNEAEDKDDQDDDDDKYENDIDEHDNVITDKNDQIADETDSTMKDGDDQDDSYKSEIYQHGNQTDINDLIANDTDSTMKAVESTKNTKKSNAKLKEPSKRIRQRKPKSDSNNKRSDRNYILAKLQQLFTISAVKLEDAIAAVQSRKTSEPYISALYKCEVCCRGYPSEPKYEKHALKHTEKFGNLVCPVCKFRYKSKDLLNRHIVVQHGNKFLCKECDYVTSSSTRAHNHYNYHAGAQNKCPHCAKIFINKTSYYSHLRIKHACNFACEWCGHTFLSQLGVDRHRRLMHKLDDSCAQDIDGPFCEACDIRFATKEAYDKHLRMSSRHNDATQLSEGRNTYEVAAGGARRKRRPPRRKPVTCEQCNVTLESVQSYAHHFRWQHPTKTRTQYVVQSGVRVVCEQCGKKFHCLATLKAHMPVHTGERFKCDHCGKAFKGKINLYQHLKIHEPSRPKYTCELCGKLFHFSHNLKRHVQLHTNATPFACDTCGKGVTTRLSLQAHIDHVHSGKPWPKRCRRKKKHTQSPQTKQQSID